jgi:predicted phosphodiesterase
VHSREIAEKLRANPVLTRIWEIILPVLVVLLFLLFLTLLAGTSSEFGPFSVSFDLGWGWPGESRLVIPLLGEIKAYTHRWPVIFSLRVEKIDPALLQHELAGYANPQEYLGVLLPRLQQFFYFFLVKLVVLGGVAGGVVSLLFGRRDFHRLWRAVAAGFCAVLLFLGSVALDYDREAFKNPRYEGMLAFAPWVLQVIDQGLSYLPELSERLSLVAGNMDRLVTQVDLLTPLAKADGEVKILHVSDIHNNPAAFEFIKPLIEGFAVDLVVDTGDLTDYGTAVETGLAGIIKTLAVPYLFIPGNHDSPEVINSLNRLPNLIILRRGTYDFQGLTILGWEDPAARNSGVLLAEEEELAEEAEALAGYLESLSENVDLLATHNKKLAGKVKGRIPVILHGHDHRAAVSNEGETYFINAGTSGAAGLRGLENDPPPYSVALLRFNRSKEPGPGASYRLSAVDLVRVYSLGGKLTLERMVVNEPETMPDREENGGEDKRAPGHAQEQ